MVGHRGDSPGLVLEQRDVLRLGPAVAVSVDLELNPLTDAHIFLRSIDVTDMHEAVSLAITFDEPEAAVGVPMG